MMPERAADRQRLLTVDAVARMLSLSRRTVYAIIRAGDLPVVRIRTAPHVKPIIRVTPEAVDGYIKRIEQQQAHGRRGLFKVAR